MKRGGRNVGFSLAETMLVFALIAILGGLAYINIIEQKKNLNFMEYNETAKEIFLAAQEHLSAAYAKRELHDFDVGNVGVYGPLKVDVDALKRDDNDPDFGSHISGNLYALYIKGGQVSTVSGGENPLAYDTMLPKGSILPGQNFAILYDRDTYRVLDVFYTGEDYDFSWGYAEWKEHCSKLSKDYLKNFPVSGERTIIMGYYGQVNVSGASVASGGSFNPFTEEYNHTPTPPSNGINPGLMIVNGPVLYALVTLDSGYTYTDVKLNLKQISPNMNLSHSIQLINNDLEAKPLKSTLGYLVILDDATTSDGYFSMHNIIQRGAQVQAWVTAEGYINNEKEKFTGTTEPDDDSNKFNSLFANSSDPANGTVYIENFRHLQNLTKSALTGELTAILNQSLGWNTFKNTDIPNYREYANNITKPEMDFSGSPVVYAPIVPKSTLHFRSKDGYTYKIRGLELPNKENSGLFGTLKDNTTIERIEMQGTSVAGTPTNAGALIGTVTAGEVTVSKVASYGKSWATASANGEATTITASGSAGGLVGAITAGTVTLNQCAAAHLVTATGTDGNAGGLVGSVASGATLNVTFSYAGSGLSGDKGRQKDGDGNLIKNVEGTYAGGLIGRVESKHVTLENSYSTASAYGTKAAGNLYTAPDTATVTTSRVVYGAGSYQVSGGGISKGAAVSAPSGRKEGSPYNHDLKNDTWKNFPYKSVEIMGGGDAAAWWTIHHIGDWPPIDNLPTANAGTGGTREIQKTETAKTTTIVNDNVRYAWIQIPEGITTDENSVITLAVSNPGENEASNAVLYTYSYNGAAWSPTGSAPPMESDSSLDPALDTENHKWLRVPLDDITTPGHRFRDLYAGVSADKPVCVRAGIDTQTLDFASLKSGAESVSWDAWATNSGGETQYPNTGYVLFDIAETADNTYTAGISNIRHLQNLDTSVSGVGNTFTKAELLTDLDETAATWPDGSAWTAKSIQVGASATAKSFYGISNGNLTEFNGNNKTLSNFTIDRTLDDGNGLEKDAGLFRALSPMAESEAENKATVYNLTLENFTVKAGTDGNAGALAAVATATTEKEVRIRNIWIKEPGGVAEAAKVGVTADKNAGGAVGVVNDGGKLKIEQVLVQSKKNSVTSSGNGAAGGLVGANGGTLTIDNSAATMYVSANSGTAGGLIGLIADTKSATVTNSYAGGHTEHGKYADADWNVKSTSGAAGGLVGEVGNNSTLSAAQSFSAASVKGGTAANGTAAGAGGVIGTASGTVTFSGPVYAAGPVDNVNEQTYEETPWPTFLTNKTPSAGAFFGTGTANLKNAYYLPQIYDNGELFTWKDEAKLFTWTNALSVTAKTSNIAYRGQYSNDAEQAYAAAASYGDATSPIAGKQNSNANLEYKTFHCDESQTTEYPFAVWTQFQFDKGNPENTTPNFYYYGDFEAVQNTSTINVTVKFEYPYQATGDIVQLLPGFDTAQSVSRTVPYTKYEGLSVLPPSLPHVDGYEFQYWQLSTGSGGTGNVQFTSGAYDPLKITRNQIVKAFGAEPEADVKDENGNIVDKSSTRTITVTAVYTTDSARTVQYLSASDITKFPGYNAESNPLPDYPTGGDAYTLLASQRVTKDTLRKDLKPPEPSLVGYDFQGYFTAPSGGEQVFSANSDSKPTAVNPSATLKTLLNALPDGQPLKLYARFAKINYCDIVVKTTYAGGGEPTELFRDRCKRGEPYSKSVALPNTSATLNSLTVTPASVSATTPSDGNLAVHLSADKTTVASVTYLLAYDAEPVTGECYKIQYVMHHTKLRDGETPGVAYSEDKCEGAGENGEDPQYSYYPYDTLFTHSQLMARTGSTAADKIPEAVPGFQVGSEDKNGEEYVMENYTEDKNGNGVQDEEVIIDGTAEHPYIVRYHYFRKSYPVEFNSLGGTNCDPIEVYFGQQVEIPDEAQYTPERPGYEFKGWNSWKKKDTEEKTDFQRGTNGKAVMPVMPSEPENGWVMQASWKRSNRQYRVVFWRQKSTCPVNAPFDPQNYDFISMETRIWVNRNVDEENVDEDPVVYLADADKNKAGAGDFKACHYNDHSDQYVSVPADGKNAVLNVYYDRDVHTLYFMTQQRTQYNHTYATDDGTWGYVNGQYVSLSRGNLKTPNYYYGNADDESGTQYGFVNESFVQLSYYNGSWYYNWQKYTGLRYKKFTAYEWFTGDGQIYNGPRFKKETRNGTYWAIAHTLTALYGHNIGDDFVKAYTAANKDYSRWDEVVCNGHPITYQQVLGYLDIMPDYDMLFRFNEAERYDGTFHYCVPILGEHVNGATGEWQFNGTWYKEYQAFTHRFGIVTYTEDVQELEGFEKLPAERAGQPPFTKNGNTPNGIDPNEYVASVSEYGRNNYFYYTRNSYKLFFYDTTPGHTGELGSIDVPYEAKIYGDTGYTSYIQQYININKNSSQVDKNGRFKTGDPTYQWDGNYYVAESCRYDETPPADGSAPKDERLQPDATMPSHDVVIYLNFKKQERTVKFTKYVKDDDGNDLMDGFYAGEKLGEEAYYEIPVVDGVTGGADFGEYCTQTNKDETVTIHLISEGGKRYVNVTEDGVTRRYEAIVKEEKRSDGTKYKVLCRKTYAEGTHKQYDEDAEPLTFTVEDGENADEIVAHAAGLKPWYKPTYPPAEYGGKSYPKGIYKFDGWYFRYTDTADGKVKEKKYNSGMIITTKDGNPYLTNGELCLYPRWTDRRPDPGSVSIRCYHKGANGEKILLPFRYKGEYYLLNEDGTAYANGVGFLDKDTASATPSVEVGKPYTVLDTPEILNAEGAVDGTYRYKPGVRSTFVRKNDTPDSVREDNVIWLEYESAEWSYEFEYWVRLRDLTHKTDEQWLPDSDGESSESFAFLVRKPGETSTELSKTVTISKPLKMDENGDPILDPSYTGYMVVGYGLASEDTADTNAENPGTLHMDRSALVRPGTDRSNPVIIRVYLEVDPTCIQLPHGVQFYNGRGHNWEIAVHDGDGEIREEEKWRINEEKSTASKWVLDPPANLTPPTGVQYTAYRQYWDMSEVPPKNPHTDNPDTDGLPMNSGTYAETVYITAKYTPSEGVEKTYLLWKSADLKESGTTYLTINPLAITLKSDSAEREFNGEPLTVPLTAETVTVIGDNQFVDTDKTKYEIMINKGGYEVVNPDFVTFAVDSFRRSKGTTTNIFEVNLPLEIAQNYNITKVYGTLEVK